MRISEIQRYPLNEARRVVLPDDAIILAVDGDEVVVEVVVERYNVHD
jgi:hypothetical protein